MEAHVRVLEIPMQPCELFLGGGKPPLKMQVYASFWHDFCSLGIIICTNGTLRCYVRAHAS